jgi:hypothetical protein
MASKQYNTCELHFNAWLGKGTPDLELTLKLLTVTLTVVFLSLANADLCCFYSAATPSLRRGGKIWADQHQA